MSIKILVYVDQKGITHKVGTLSLQSRRKIPDASFKFDSQWQKNADNYALNPLFEVTKNFNHPHPNLKSLGSIGDSTPDNWGRFLVTRNYRYLSEQEKQELTKSDAGFLLAAGDFTRQGALRFATEEGGSFLRTQEQSTIPPLRKLDELLKASLNLRTEAQTDNDVKLLHELGSALGGARAKASVLDKHNQLAIAKFPEKSDRWPVIQWEAVALTIAHNAGIPVPKWSLEKIVSEHVLVLQRFDRIGTKRIPFLSAMSMIKTKDFEHVSYLDLLDAIRRHGSRPKQDAQNLWKRIVFNILISNTDDHLRNHGFLYADNGWMLSPAYDMNPTPIRVRQEFLSLAIDEVSPLCSMELAFDTAKKFGINSKQAKSIAHKVGLAVTKWREYAKQFGLNDKECDLMASAFEHEDLPMALNSVQTTQL